MKRPAHFVFAALTAIAILPLAAATVYVDDDWAGQGGDGSAERPFGTLQEAGAAMSTFDNMSVADGTYSGDVDFGSMTLTNEVPSGTATYCGDVATSGTFNRTGAGTLVLNGTNTFGSLLVHDGKTIVAPPNAGVTNSLSLAGLTIYSGKSLIVSNAVTTIKPPSTVNVNTYAGSTLAFVGGELTASIGNLKYFSPGGGGTATSPAADLILDGVKATFSGSGSLCPGSTTPGRIIITNDANVRVENFFARRGDIYQYSGKVDVYGGGSDAFILGYNVGYTANYHLYGGTLDKSPSGNTYWADIGGARGQGASGKGYLYIYSGGEAIIRCPYCSVGTGKLNASGQKGGVYVRGGKFTMPYHYTGHSYLYVGYMADGELEVSDGGLATIDGSVIVLSNSAGSRTGKVSLLSNGTLKARRLVSNANVNGTGDTATLILDGGRVVANTSATAEFMQGFTAASVGVGGGTVDTAGQNLTIAQSFAARTGTGQSAPVASTAAELAALPAFTKAGAGTLTLMGTNDWLCAMCVSNGTLVVADRALPATTLQLRGGVIDLGGNSFTVANLVGFGVVSNGTLTVTGAVWPGVYESGTLKIDSTATLNMTTLGCCIASDGTGGCLEVAGAQSLAGVTVVGEGMANKTYRGITLVKATTFTGSPTADSSLAGNGISVSGGKLRIGAPGVIISVW